MSDHYNSLIEELLIKLKKPLAERPSREEISPLDLENRLKALRENKNPKKSAVLILLYNKEGEWHFPLMKRSDYGPHRSQISLPGGKKEKEDINLESTAIRETYEELGVQQDLIKIVGHLTDVYIPPSKFLVTPFVGIFQKRKINFSPSKEEVQELLEIPLTELLQEKNFKTGSIPVSSNLRVKTQYFDLNQKIVWGATAIILKELKQVIQEDI